VIDSIVNPNGLAFSPDEKILYVVDCGTTPRSIRAFTVTDSGRGVGAGRVLIDAGPGTPDGFRCDEDGNLWCGWGMGTEELDGVRVFSPAASHWATFTCRSAAPTCASAG
jgi:gluconolactonase